MLEIKDLSIFKRDNGQQLLNDFSLVLNKNDKCAIIGEEGNGKTTLLKAIYDKSEIDNYCDLNGQINYKGNIAYLRQMVGEEWNEFTVRDFILKNNYDSDPNYDLYNDYNKIIESFLKLKLDDSFLDSDQLIKTLSGGEKVKLSLLKILLSNPSIILLDEPTNDLDIETLEFLEEFINNESTPILFVSHDETLLERTANMIVHLEQIKRKTEVRNFVVKDTYTNYIKNREKHIEKHNQLAISEQKEYKKEKTVLTELKRLAEIRNSDDTSRMRQLVAQEKRLEKRNVKSRYAEEEAISIFSTEDTSLPPNKVVVDYNKDLKLKTNEIIQNINIIITGKDKVVISGPNGIGKTTLLKEIYDMIKFRDDIKVGYMPQNYDEVLDYEETSIDFLLKINPDKTKIMTMMGSLNFTVEEMQDKIKNISGGTRAKLILGSLVLSGSNVLVLDEPTRNLSPLSNPEIRNLLINFKGSIISVSHDRKYISEVATKKYELSKNGLSLINNGGKDNAVYTI